MTLVVTAGKFSGSLSAGSDYEERDVVEELRSRRDDFLAQRAANEIEGLRARVKLWHDFGAGMPPLEERPTAS